VAAAAAEPAGACALGTCCLGHQQQEPWLQLWRCLQQHLPLLGLPQQPGLAQVDFMAAAVAALRYRQQPDDALLDAHADAFADLVENHLMLFRRLQHLALAYTSDSSSWLAAAETCVVRLLVRVLKGTRAVAGIEFELIRRHGQQQQQQMCMGSQPQQSLLEQRHASGQQQRQPADPSSRPWTQYMNESPGVIAEQFDYPCCLLYQGELLFQRRSKEAQVALQEDEQALPDLCRQQGSAAEEHMRNAVEKLNNRWQQVLRLKLHRVSCRIEQSRRSQQQQQQQQQQHEAAAAAAAASPLLSSWECCRAQLLSVGLEMYRPFTVDQLREVAECADCGSGSNMMSSKSWLRAKEQAVSKPELARMLLDAGVMPPFQDVGFEGRDEPTPCQLAELDELLAQLRRQGLPSSDSGAQGGWHAAGREQSMARALVGAQQQQLLHLLSLHSAASGRACSLRACLVMQRSACL
jgi:hypothetical protein